MTIDLNKRQSGVLLHVTSLPGPHGTPHSGWQLALDSSLDLAPGLAVPAGGVLRVPAQSLLVFKETLDAAP